jgi:hypothetical protein
MHFISILTTDGDEDISPLHTIQEPITRARAQQLDLQVHSNLVNCFSELILGSMHLSRAGNDWSGGSTVSRTVAEKNLDGERR